MKCPKCDYLGFETGDRCKNCGYDFSLAVDATSREAELMLREPETPSQRDADRWLTQLEARLDNVRPAAMATPSADPLGPMSLDAPSSTPAASAPVAAAVSPAAAPLRTPWKSTPALPLFHPGGADWDEPLIKVPGAPRPPLAVRRTPDRPKLRTVPKPVRRIYANPDPEGVLEFAEEPAPGAAVRQAPRIEPVIPAAREGVNISGAGRRMFAAVVDQLILLSIDVIVIYFTFQIAGLPFSEWQAVPVLPLMLFLLMVKASYFSVFTALGGQTVGKMATGIRVVGEDDRDVNPSRAVQRTLAALASVATVGLGYAPVLLGGDRRTLHDRVAGTRVVGPFHE